MNLFYEEYPEEIIVNGKEIPIITDFREYIRLLDMLQDDSLSLYEKVFYVRNYFKENPEDFLAAFEELMNFVTMERMEEQEGECCRERKQVYSFEIDYPFIFSAFLHDYGINLRSIKYMHWWEFRMLFDGLSDNTEIKKRMLYRGIDLSTIKDADERKRIQRIQQEIMLPDAGPNDYDIGEAFGW